STSDALLSIAGDVEVRGGFTFSKSAPISATLSDGSSKSLSVTTFAFSNVYAFFGEGPYFTLTNGVPDALNPDPGTLQPTTGFNSDAAGLLLSGGDLAVALFKPTNGADHSTYYAVRASLGSVSLPGVDLGTSTLPLTASGYRIEVNGGPTVNGKKVAVDFSKLPG